MEPGASEDATMEGSESQILQPLDSRSTSITLPMKADFPINAGYLVEASSKDHTRFSSLTSKLGEGINDGVRGDAADKSPFSSLDCAFEFFLVFEGISPTISSKLPKLINNNISGQNTITHTQPIWLWAFLSILQLRIKQYSVTPVPRF